jgi:hypothetical protein
MATKTKALKTPKVPKTAKGAVKTRMSMKERFDLMQFIKDADPATPDATLAAEASVGLGRPVAQITVRSYRENFGLASVPKPRAGNLFKRIAQLEQAILALGGKIPTP